jgi:hypothetical protein
MDMMSWVINGQRFDPARVDATPRLGSTEIWRFQNGPMMAHPIHLNMFQILDRNGTPPSEAEAGWKDTVAVGPDETVRVIVRFTDYSGLYMVHCHNLEHEDNAMMAQFRVMPPHPTCRRDERIPESGFPRGGRDAGTAGAPCTLGSTDRLGGGRCPRRRHRLCPGDDPGPDGQLPPRSSSQRTASCSKAIPVR